MDESIGKPIANGGGRVAGGGGGGAPMCAIEYGERRPSLVTLESSVVVGGIAAAAHKHPFSSRSSSSSLAFVSAVAATAVVSGNTSSGSFTLSERSPQCLLTTSMITSAGTFAYIDGAPPQISLMPSLYGNSSGSVSLG